ncbi:hypothetical protein FKM82_029244, partial [Ascaphus truei]
PFFLPPSLLPPSSSSQGERGRPVNVSYPGLAKNPLCWYKVQIQPFITACGNDCRRYSYTEPCPTDPALPTSPPGELLNERGEEKNKATYLQGWWRKHYTVLQCCVHMELQAQSNPGL